MMSTGTEKLIDLGIGSEPVSSGRIRSKWFRKNEVKNLLLKTTNQKQAYILRQYFRIALLLHSL